MAAAPAGNPVGAAAGRASPGPAYPEPATVGLAAAPAQPAAADSPPVTVIVAAAAAALAVGALTGPVGYLFIAAVLQLPLALGWLLLLRAPGRRGAVAVVLAVIVLADVLLLVPGDPAGRLAAVAAAAVLAGLVGQLFGPVSWIRRKRRTTPGGRRPTEALAALLTAVVLVLGPALVLLPLRRPDAPWLLAAGFFGAAATALAAGALHRVARSWFVRLVDPVAVALGAVTAAGWAVGGGLGLGLGLSVGLPAAVVIVLVSRTPPIGRGRAGAAPVLGLLPPAAVASVLAALTSVLVA